MTRPTKPTTLPSGLEIWTVYNSPTDYPGKFVARLFINEQPTTLVMVADALTTIRKQLSNKGFVRIPRSEGDEPQIVECWL